jgi:hypothetical protein
MVLYQTMSTNDPKSQRLDDVPAPVELATGEAFSVRYGEALTTSVNAPASAGRVATTPPDEALEVVISHASGKITAVSVLEYEPPETTRYRLADGDACSWSRWEADGRDDSLQPVEITPRDVSPNER